ncbi:hypothetical protein CDL12_30039 [Handroanthus impetiginosus]|uniref:F-box associated domain-containing protein n=1 Tax=Handroanthus impetiginosus TaxID=429701 RepID=A0A2G9FWQ2_9LAMI|nr:hypothetical protein CDL12_30039 [Handroanthus impetiginosus]
MGVQCYVWIVHLFKQILIGDYDGNAVKNTLSRLSAQVALRCRKVFKMLLSSSSQSTSDQGGDRGRPLILRYFLDLYPRLSIINVESGTESKPWELKALKFTEFIACCDELVLLQSILSPKTCSVVNPRSKQKVKTIHIPTLSHGNCCFPCGFFFHPLAKEYRILVGCLDSAQVMFEYYLYLFGANMWRRTSTPYFDRIPKYNWSNFVVINSSPAIVNGRLHWLVSEIMVFDMVSEEFCVKPLCFGECNIGGAFYMRELLVKDDSLCFCNISHEERSLDIWFLEDYGNWHWNKKYVIKFDWYPPPLYTELMGISVLSFQKDELVLFWRSMGIYSCNLAFNTVTNIHLRKSEYDARGFDNWRMLYGFAAYNGRTSG